MFDGWEVKESVLLQREIQIGRYRDERQLQTKERLVPFMGNYTNLRLRTTDMTPHV